MISNKPIKYSPQTRKNNGNSIFNDKNKKPDQQMLKDALGKTHKFWKEIKTIN
jgi:hypothetical protein